MASGESYFSVLTRAVNDVALHGYDSEERISFWAEELRRAAERSMRSMDEVERMVREGLTAVFRRQVEQGAVLRLNPGVKAYTLERVRPELHAELNRKIAASIDLIKVNRPQAILKTQQRFRGWATSIPAGGSDTVQRREQKAEIRKSLSQLPYSERRCIIDQSAKLVAAINTTVAINGGAIGGFWQSHLHQRGYDGRPAHNARDGKFFLIKDSWADKAGLVKPGPAGYSDGVEQPAELPFCFPGDSLVPYADGVTVGYSRFYAGELTEITTANGFTIRATPNHPIMTPRGWVAIDLLNEGDEVLEVRDNLISPVKLDDDHTVSTISEIFSTLEEFGIASSRLGSLHQFHGDGTNGDVNTVDATWPLTFGSDFNRIKSGLQFYLSKSFAPTAVIRSAYLFLIRSASGYSHFMRIFREFSSSLRPLAVHPNISGLTSCPRIDSDREKPISDHSTRCAELSRQRENTVPFIIFLNDFIKRNLSLLFRGPSSLPVESGSSSSRIKSACIDTHDFRDFKKRLPFATKVVKLIKINRDGFSGHVYNLETADGWYIVNNILVSNCKCSWQYVYSLRSVPPECLTEKGRQALIEARKKAAAA